MQLTEITSKELYKQKYKIKSIISITTNYMKTGIN